ncbi:hypothetical protein M404DRAFT_26584 [Pisolithus tinctorius Marx 270]|uniref:RRM domain-containing protein n=1 Tax=Pisolithus tinctorius Marx 270 TaxID=870435 RepID=A0A0C3NYJ8_PISTI|nr:hypothetical protein M404DRAFT_29829 [Pisolithus tinctorius Marx 270]KIO03961.1 hypothetical protein M404DRAFT_26584 [Pisolithus tinctorius Marx 270]
MPRSAQSPHLLGGEVPPAIELLTIHSKLPFRFVLRNELLSPPDPTHARSKFIPVPPPLVRRFQFPLEVSDNEFIRNVPFEPTSDEFENLFCHFRQPSATAILQSGNAETNTLFIGTISGGITDDILKKLLGIRPLKMMSSPADLSNKHRSFGFVDYEDPESAIRCIDLLNGVELPAHENFASQTTNYWCPRQSPLDPWQAYTSMKICGSMPMKFMDACPAQKMKAELSPRASIRTLVGELVLQPSNGQLHDRTPSKKQKSVTRLDVWDDDKSDELYYVDRCAIRHDGDKLGLVAEEAADGESHAYEEHEAENLHIESEKLLTRQMGDIRELAKKLRKAGTLLDDGAHVKLNVSLLGPAPVDKLEPHAQREVVKGAAAVPLVKLNLSVAGLKAKEHLETIKQSAPHDTEMLFKGQMKFGPIIKHRKDHNGPLKLVEGLELVLEEEAQEFAINTWRRVIFENMAYGEGLQAERMMVD